MEIRKLTQYDAEVKQSLGNFGYVSKHKFVVHKEESTDALAITLNLIELEQPYVKQEFDTDDHSSKLVEAGYSYGLYVNEELAAVAIAQPQTWNKTLLIWHFQVASSHQRKSYGKQLMNRVIETAKEEGFRAVTLETQNTNVPAIRFYQSCGFEIEGIDLSFYTNHDIENGEVAIFMKKKL